MPLGRFAPSPTGRLHVGNLRTALVAWLAARADHSPFLIRFEDLDTASVRAEHYQGQLDDLAALGLDWDQPVVRQSDRLDRYREAIDRLVADEAVFPCFCSRREIREAASAPHEGRPDTPAAHEGHPTPQRPTRGAPMAGVGPVAVVASRRAIRGTATRGPAGICPPPSGTSGP